MKFTTPALVEQVVWQLRLADLPRGVNRASIDRLFNGLPPYPSDDDRARKSKTNVNFLEAPRLAADARKTYANAFLKPGVFFNIQLDYGPVFKRRAWANILTREMNKAMKGSRKYFEFLRSQFALTVLHGIGPGNWYDQETWCPRCLGVEDVMVPSSTLLTFENLNYFAIFRQYTAMELYLMTHGPKVDPGWNMPVVEGALKWADEQTQSQISYSELYAPQKTDERYHQDLGFYGSDSVPTIDTWDFYFYSDEDNQQGWRRRMVLDTPMAENVSRLPGKNLIGAKHDQWLYNPGDKRIYAEKLDRIMHFQFGDATATAPFRYHSVRSLGWLLYAVCHLQNRLRCAVNDAVFESLLNYFWATNPDDKERIEKIDLQDMGIVPEGLKFVTQAERWKVDQNLVSMGLQQNEGMMTESAAQYREGRNDSTGGKEKTATEIMAQVNSANALVGSLLLQAYCYHKFQGMEIARRFCIKNSKDADVRRFRNCVLKEGVPEEALDSERWDVEPERVLGNGNKTLEIAMADKLMAVRPLHDPESQREILYLYDMANSDNPDLAERLVPMDKGKVSKTVSETRKMMGSLMLGVKMPPEQGMNPAEVISTLLESLQPIMAPMLQGKPATPDELQGIGNVLLTAGEYLGLLMEDKSQKELSAKLKNDISTVDGLLKQILQKNQKAQPQQAPPDGTAAKDAIKIQTAKQMGELKIALAAKSHQQKTIARDTQTGLQMQREHQRHEMDLKHKADEAQLQADMTVLKTATEVRKNRLKSVSE